VREIRLPRLNSNDTTYVLLEWLGEQAGPVRRGEPLALVETSKAVEELVAEADGVLHRIGAEGSEHPVGALVGLQFDTVEALEAYLASPAAGQAGAETAGYTLTDAARELVERHHVPAAVLAGLGRAVIRARDVDAALPAPPGAGSEPPAPGAGSEPPAASPVTRQQAAVAAIVTRSHREIPAAFTVLRVYVDRARELSRRISRERGIVVGLPEMLVRALALARTEHPQLYGDGAARPDGPDIGVTVDVGTGLFIPVLRGAAGLPLDEIAETLMDFRKRAVRRMFREADLDGAGDLVLSLSHEPDVVVAQPIVFPGHAGMVSLGGALEELHLDGGTVRARTYVHIGLAYDHRRVNGREAVDFLRTVKALVEAPERLDVPPDGGAG
jgi:2-oxoglutarate dehydrogenase E2 component (dihydrolipoamide succinyltransferase)